MKSDEAIKRADDAYVEAKNVVQYSRADIAILEEQRANRILIQEFMVEMSDMIWRINNSLENIEMSVRK